MQRICGSLQANGYDVKLIGVKRKKSIELLSQNFKQKRISIFFEKGFLFYAEYNLKLFFCLLFSKTDAFCAIDLDTVIPNYFASILRRKKRVYDAHELFTELNEVVNNPKVKRFWDKVESFAVPKFPNGYTVNQFLKNEFARKYKVSYEVIRNIPKLQNQNLEIPNSKFQIPNIIYQGAVNFGRGFEQLIPAMKNVNAELHIYGIGNFYNQVKDLIKENHLESKVKLYGATLPNELKQITPTAKFGITIFEAKGLNQYYSLANRFFDYIMAGIPQICVNYPEYKILNNEFDIGVMVDNIEIETLSNAINILLTDEILYNRLKQNCITAREKLNWQNEEKKLISFWKNIFT
jgi:glycosyltransferase involved in cell wall biosynthesis